MAEQLGMRMSDYGTGDTEVAELPYLTPPPFDDAVALRNGLMFPRIDGVSEISGKIQSSDGKTYFDLEKGRINMNDGANDRMLIGSDAL